jgi:hypothetical protein
MAALTVGEGLFATRHAVDRWRERVKADGPAMAEIFSSARRSRPATLAELRDYKPLGQKGTRLAVDDEAGVVHFLKPAWEGGWVVVTVVKVGAVL